MLDEGRYAPITEMAGAERLDRRYMGWLLQLTLLAPGIVEAVLDGSPATPDLARLLQPWPAVWADQTTIQAGK